MFGLPLTLLAPLVGVALLAGLGLLARHEYDRATAEAQARAVLTAQLHAEAAQRTAIVAALTRTAAQAEATAAKYGRIGEAIDAAKDGSDCVHSDALRALLDGLRQPDAGPGDAGGAGHAADGARPAAGAR